MESYAQDGDVQKVVEGRGRGEGKRGSVAPAQE